MQAIRRTVSSTTTVSLIICMYNKNNKNSDVYHTSDIYQNYDIYHTSDM